MTDQNSNKQQPTNQLQLVFTGEAVQRYIRIGVYALSGALVNHGLVAADASWLPSVTGALLFILNLAWTIYGNRVIARIQELAKVVNADGTTVKIITDKETAKIIPDANVMSKEDVKVVTK